MNWTGIVRRTDKLGHIVIPADVRRQLGIHAGDTVEILVGEQGIAFRKCSEPARGRVESDTDTREVSYSK